MKTLLIMSVIASMSLGAFCADEAASGNDESKPVFIGELVKTHGKVVKIQKDGEYVNFEFADGFKYRVKINCKGKCSCSHDHNKTK